MPEPSAPQTKADLAVIFAGGEGRRMGGLDKGALLLDGKPLWRVVSDRLSPQAGALAVVAPKAPAWLPELSSAQWIADARGLRGPPAAMLAALQFLETRSGPEALLLTAPVDSPFLPENLFTRLDATRRKAGTPAAIVRHNDRLQPVFGLWQAGSARAFATAAKLERALYAIAARAGAIECDAWADATPNPFTNLNTPEDLAAAQQALRDS